MANTYISFTCIEYVEARSDSRPGRPPSRRTLPPQAGELTKLDVLATSSRPSNCKKPAMLWIDESWLACSYWQNPQPLLLHTKAALRQPPTHHMRWWSIRRTRDRDVRHQDVYQTPILERPRKSCLILFWIPELLSVPRVAIQDNCLTFTLAEPLPSTKECSGRANRNRQQLSSLSDFETNASHLNN